LTKSKTKNTLAKKFGYRQAHAFVWRWWCHRHE